MLKPVYLAAERSDLVFLPVHCQDTLTAVTILYATLYILEPACFLSITYERIMLAIIKENTGHQEMAF